MRYPILIVSALLVAGCGDTAASDADATGEVVGDTGMDGSGLGDPNNPDAQADAGPTGDASGADTAGTDATGTDAGTPGVDATGPDGSTTEDVSADAGTDASASDVTPDPGTGGCLADLFVEPDAHPANAAYADPMLAARCEGGELIVESNGIIGYEFQAMTPAPLAAQDYEWRVPLEPTWSETVTSVPLLGDIGFSVTGIPLYGPNEGAMPDPYGDPVYNAIVDWCLGHTGLGGTYHLHAMLVECIVDAVTEEAPSPIIGFALDGYPIYGPIACVDEACTETMEVRSGWVQTGDPSTYAWDNHEYVASDDPEVLDQCNGRIGPDGQYRYHATETFPYILGCYHGVADAGTDGPGDPGDPGDPGPTECSSNAECAGECGPAATSCVCGSTPRGSRCVPGCTTSAECPTDAPTPLVCTDGACVPGRP